MFRTKCALSALLLMGAACSLVGCHNAPSEADSTKAADAKSAAPADANAPSLGNPKPAEGAGK